MKQAFILLIFFIHTFFFLLITFSTYSYNCVEKCTEHYNIVLFFLKTYLYYIFHLICSLGCILYIDARLKIYIYFLIKYSMDGLALNPISSFKCWIKCILHLKSSANCTKVYRELLSG